MEVEESGGSIILVKSAVERSFKNWGKKDVGSRILILKAMEVLVFMLIDIERL